MTPPWGGKRQGAGRPKGSGKFGESTQSVRVPKGMVDNVMEYVEQKNSYALPLYGSKVAAGFPSPADDFLEGKLDLNEHLIDHPSATFFVRVSGESMLKAGIFPGDLLVVDKSLEAVHGRVIIAIVNNELTVKRLNKQNGHISLDPENDEFEPIIIGDEDELAVWGVVTNVIHGL